MKWGQDGNAMKPETPYFANFADQVLPWQVDWFCAAVKRHPVMPCGGLCKFQWV
jgi:hypothetical protein